MLKLIPLYILALCLCILPACAPMKHNYAPVVTHLDFPELNTTTTAHVGDAMLTQGTMLETEVLDNPSQISGMCYEIPPSIYPKTGFDDTKTFFSHVGDRGQITRSGLCDPVAGFYVPNTKDKLCVINHMGGTVCYDGNFTIKKMGITATSHVQMSLVYSGKEGDAAKFMYVEKNGPHTLLSHNISYNIKNDSMIVYKGARIKVLECSNESITYEVLQNLQGRM